MVTRIASLLGRLQEMVQGSGVRYIHANSAEVFTPATTTLPLSNTDRRLLTKTFKLMDDVVKCCQSHRLNLKNSPPFILDILPDTYSQLVYIFTNDPTILKGNTYLQLAIANIQTKCKMTLKLFRTSAIYEEDSVERRLLTKYSLIFSHMLFELKAEFPNGVFVGDKFRITKKEAEEFWTRQFPKKTIVSWTDFITALGTVHPITKISTQMAELKNTIDLTNNNYVSNFEFDVFTRLFYPWTTLVKNWELLTTSHPGYVAFLTYDEVKKKLETLVSRPGSYVFRLSCTRPGQWAIGYVAPDGRIFQTIPQNKSLIQALQEGNKEGFYLYPNGSAKNIDLDRFLDIPPADRVKVTSEQFDLYCEMGTTFELCKICDDRDKDMRIEPCGHLLCGPCLMSWQESEGGNTCPFCRYEIKGTNKVIIDKYQPTEEKKRKKTPPKFGVIETVREESSSDDRTLSESELPIGPPPPLPPRPKSMLAARISNSDGTAYVNVNSLPSPVDGSVPRDPAPVAPIPEYINTCPN